MVINYIESESAIDKLNAQSSSHYYWDGWTVVKFTPDASAMYDKDGAYNKDIGWGFTKEYNVGNDGLWKIDS